MIPRTANALVTLSSLASCNSKCSVRANSIAMVLSEAGHHLSCGQGMKSRIDSPARTRLISISRTRGVPRCAKIWRYCGGSPMAPSDGGRVLAVGQSVRVGIGILDANC